MLLFGNYVHSMIMLYMCFIQQVRNIGTGTNLFFFAYHHFSIQLRTHCGGGGGGGLSEHPLLIFGLISLIPFIPVTNIDNFPTLCPLNFYLICVNIQFAIKYIHSPHISSFPLKFVLKYRVSQKPPTGFVNVPLWGSTRVLPYFWSSQWQLLFLPSQPKKMYV